MKKKYYILFTLLCVLFISTGCFRDRKKLEEYRTKLKTAESVLEEKHPIETHNLSVNKRKFGLNERVVISQNEEPLVAFTFTKVSGKIRDITDNPEYTDKDNTTLRVDITYENINYSKPYDIISSFMYSSNGKDSSGDVLRLNSHMNDKSLSSGESNKVTCFFETKELAKKIDYITFKYYYPKSLLEGHFSDEDYIDIKLPLEG